MITVDDREQIRRAYFVEHKSLRQIAREFKHSRKTLTKAIESAEPARYTLHTPRSAPILGPFKARIEALLVEDEQMPRKQHYTAHKIYELLAAEGYSGSESHVRGYVAELRQTRQRPATYLPLEFDPGADAQVDWGEGVVELDGERITVQLFMMRLCYSRRLFVMAFPTQKQEAFFEGHVQAFHHFGGVPHRLSYDNLKVAVQRILEGRNRQEQQAFVVFRSHYLFESHFCTPGQGHEKGGVEHGVGFGRRNFLVPIPKVHSFEALNAHLRSECLKDDQRRVDRQPHSIGEAWQLERPHLRALPTRDFDCCVSVAATLSPYSQVVFETNRYSVPVDEAYQQVVIKAYAFRLDILHLDKVIASHPRCYAREQDLFDPLHYLPLLEQRPGAFEHAKPLRHWRANWPPIYEQVLERLRSQWPDGRGVREFVRILKLHQAHPAEQIEQALGLALEYGCVHADGVGLCLHQLLRPEARPPALDLAEQPRLQRVGRQPLDLGCYERLLAGR